MNLRTAISKGVNLDPVDDIKIKKPKNITPQQWERAKNLYNAAVNVGDKFPELTVAQAALETGWFKKESGTNNYFGQKATQSQKGSGVTTHEVINGQKIKIQDRFRDYNTIEESLLDRQKKWMSKYENASSPSEAINSIWRYDSQKQQGVGYATDPEYDKKLLSIMRGMGVDVGQSKTNYKNQTTTNPNQTVDNSYTNTPIGKVISYDDKEEAEDKTKPLTEEAIRKIFQEENSRGKEQAFLEAYKQKAPPQQEQPQQVPMQQEDLYDYVDISQFKDGGSISNNCGGPGQPPCDENYFKTMQSSRGEQTTYVTGKQGNYSFYDEPQYKGQEPSTHLMADDNVGKAWPAIARNSKGEWINQSQEEAIKNNEIYTFPNREKMVEFAREGSWKNKYEDGGTNPPVTGPSQQPQDYADKFFMKNQEVPNPVFAGPNTPEPYEKGITVPKTKEDIIKLQNYLISKGYDVGNKKGEPDGIVGQKTIAAIREQNYKIGAPAYNLDSYTKEEIEKKVTGRWKKSTNSTEIFTKEADQLDISKQEKDRMPFKYDTKDLPAIDNSKNQYEQNNEDISSSKIGDKSEEEIKQIQQNLYEKGFLTPTRDLIEIGDNEDDIRKVQRLLVDKGYNLGEYGKDKDGVKGKVTLEAVQEYNDRAKGIDGVLGANTEKAYNEYQFKNKISKLDSDKVKERYVDIKKDEDMVLYQENLQKQGYFKGIDYDRAGQGDIKKKEYTPFNVSSETKCDDTRCTFFVNSEIQKNVSVKGREEIGAYGDAWTLSNNLINKGAKEVFSIFESSKPSISGKEIEPYLKQRIANSALPKIEEIEAGDVVNLFYEGSSSKELAYKEGSTHFTTHTGIIKQDSKGNKYIEHNVGGSVKKEPLSTMLSKEGRTDKGGLLAISAIVRPDYKINGATMNKNSNTYYDSSEAQVNPTKVSNYSKIGSENAAVFTETILKNKKRLLQDIPIDNEEFLSLTKAMKAIGWKESGFSSTIDNANDLSVRSLKKVGGRLREMGGLEELSRGLTQMKDQKNLPDNLREKYIKGNGDNLSDPKEAAIPSFYALSSRYLYLRDVVSKENLTIGMEDLTKLSLLSWNQPLYKVSASLKKYKSFDEVMKAYKGEDGKHDYELAFEAYSDYLK